MKTEKRCPQCGTNKPAGEFYKDGTKADGLSSMCKSCKRRCAVAYYESHKEERAAYAANYWRMYGKKQP